MSMAVRGLSRSMNRCRNATLSGRFLRSFHIGVSDCAVPHGPARSLPDNSISPSPSISCHRPPGACLRPGRPLPVPGPALIGANIPDDAGAPFGARRAPSALPHLPDEERVTISPSRIVFHVQRVRVVRCRVQRMFHPGALQVASSRRFSNHERYPSIYSESVITTSGRPLPVISTQAVRHISRKFGA